MSHATWPSTRRTLPPLRRCAPRIASCVVSRITSGVLALVALLAGIAPAFFLTPVASAHASAQARETDASSAAVHAVRLDSPAVVRILTVYSGRVICVACYQGRDIVFPLDGGTYPEISGGSGTLISPDGYILTADHVVDVDGAIQQDVLDQAINELAQKARISMDEARQAFAESQQAGQIRYDIGVTQRTAFLSTAYIGVVRDAAQVSDPQTAFPITRVVASSPTDQQDVAIVKVEGHDLPNARLAPPGSVHVQDGVSAIAFPGDADVGSFPDLLTPKPGSEVELNNLLTPTVESGQIIAVKRAPDGTSYYQANQIGNHGSSGGAVIDDRGDIVGFIDAGNGNDGNPTRVVDLVTNDVIASYVQQAGVTNSGQGAFMTRWTRAVDALDAGAACQATQARDDLRQLRADYPRFGAIQSLVKEAEDKSVVARCGPSAGIVAGVGLLLVLLLGAAAGVLYFLHRQGTITLPLPAGVYIGGVRFGGPAATAAPQPVGVGAPVASSASTPGFHAGSPMPRASLVYPMPYAPIPYAPLPYAPMPYATPYAPPYAVPQATPAQHPAAAPSSSSSYPGSQPLGSAVAPATPTLAGFPTMPPAMAPMTSALSMPSMPSMPSQTLASGGAVPETHRCVNGHPVTDADAHFCSECGTRLFIEPPGIVS